MEITLNSIINIIANAMILYGGCLFYYHHITPLMRFRFKKISIPAYHIMRVFTAFLLAGTLSRILYDINIIATGKFITFNAIEATIALTRNLGIGGILIYLATKKQ